MSMTVYTGLPGSGKTANCVERILMPLAGRNWEEVATTPEGEQVKVRRKLYTNINGLLLEHEKIGPGGEWKQDRDGKWCQEPGADRQGLNNWHEWAEPGSLIVFDEVQKPWPLKATGSAKPPHIEALETHRHMGVDFILLTQHPMLIDASVVRLADKHLHVRKVGNSRYATVYEWDGVSRTLLYKNAMAKKPWRRGKEVEKTYRSSALHTKQKRSMPTVLFVLAAVIVAIPVVGFYNVDKFKERYFSGKPLIAGEAKAGSKGDGKAPAAPQAPASAPAGAVVASVPEKAPTFLGCAATAKRCTCFDSAGTQVDKGPGFCKIHTEGMNGPPISLAGLVIPAQEAFERQLALSERDAELLAFAGARETAQGKARALPSATAPLPSKTPQRSAGTVAQAGR